MAIDDMSDANEFGRKYWWLFLVTGILWLLISLVVLRFTTTSVTTVGVLIGVVFGIAAINEFFTAWAGAGWKWLHIILGLLFAAGALWCFVNPKQAFWEFASLVGFLFLLNGSMYLIEAFMTRDWNPAWWLGLISGGLLIGLGFWASQQYIGPKAGLLILWVGFGAMVRGIGEIVMAFGIKSGGPRAVVVVTA